MNVSPQMSRTLPVRTSRPALLAGVDCVDRVHGQRDGGGVQI